MAGAADCHCYYSVVSGFCRLRIRRVESTGDTSQEAYLYYALTRAIVFGDLPQVYTGSAVVGAVPARLRGLAAGGGSPPPNFGADTDLRVTSSGVDIRRQEARTLAAQKLCRITEARVARKPHKALSRRVRHRERRIRERKPSTSSTKLAGKHSQF